MAGKMFPGLTYSNDAVSWELDLRSTQGIDSDSIPIGSIEFFFRDLRRSPTGLHALVGLQFAAGGDDNRADLLAHDVFNLGRDGDRWKLAKSAHAMLPEGPQAAIEALQLRDYLNRLCLWVTRFWESEHLQIEYWDAEKTYPSPAGVLPPYVYEGAGTILFAPPASGKSYLAQMWALAISTGTSRDWPITRKRPVLYVNLERSASSMLHREGQIRGALGIKEQGSLGYIHARGGSLKQIVEKVKDFGQRNPKAVAIFDSISRSGLGDLTSNDTANGFIDLVNSTGLTWVGIGHTPRSDSEHLYGSVHYDAGCDLMVKVSGGVNSTSEGSEHGLRLEVTKSNDTAAPPPNHYAMTFNREGFSGFRSARREDFVEWVDKITDKEKIIAFLADSGAVSGQDRISLSPANISNGTDISNKKISAYLSDTSLFEKKERGSWVVKQ